MFFRKNIKPSFLIIGGVKCGTSSLYRYLSEHPQVLPCQTKEPQLFSTRNPLRVLWGLPRYAALFPEKDFHGTVRADWIDQNKKGELKASSFQKVKQRGERYITGEASANTFVRASPTVVKAVLPEAKIILLLRHPTARFFSHYNMFGRLSRAGHQGFDLPPLAEFIRQEIDHYRAGRKGKILHQGVYVDHLPRWEKVYGRDGLTLVATHMLNQQPGHLLTQLCRILGLRDYDFGESLTIQHNRSAPQSMPSLLREQLDEFYEPSVKRLKSEFEIDLL